MQINTLKTLFTLIFFSVSSQLIIAQELELGSQKKINIPVVEKTVKQNDTISTSIETLIKPKDSTQTDSIKKSGAAIEDIITHTADDYIREDFRKKLMTLHNNAVIDYGEINMKEDIL